MEENEISEQMNSKYACGEIFLLMFKTPNYLVKSHPNNFLDHGREQFVLKCQILFYTI